MKRFRDTELSKEKWYRKLTPIERCFWSYICDLCDSVGVFLIDEERIEFDLGAPINIDSFIQSVNADKLRVEYLDGKNKLFITGFVEFQYGELSEKCKPHLRYIQLLKKHGLYERVCKGYTKGIHTLEEKEEEKDKEKEEEERGSGGKQKPRRIANFNEPADSVVTKELKEKYKNVIQQIESTDVLRDQITLISDFISANKPEFIDPYADLWNLSAHFMNLTKIKSITDSRIKKLKARIREPMFDFIKILSEIKNSNYLRGLSTDWKVDWDWIFEGEKNYTKILEGKYRNS